MGTEGVREELLKITNFELIGKECEVIRYELGFLLEVLFICAEALNLRSVSEFV